MFMRVYRTSAHVAKSGLCPAIRPNHCVWVTTFCAWLFSKTKAFLKITVRKGRFYACFNLAALGNLKICSCTDHATFVFLCAVLQTKHTFPSAVPRLGCSRWQGLASS